MGMNISFKAGRLFEGRICVTNPRLPRLFSRRRNNSALIDRPLKPTSMRVLTYSFFPFFHPPTEILLHMLSNPHLVVK